MKPNHSLTSSEYNNCSSDWHSNFENWTVIDTAFFAPMIDIVSNIDYECAIYFDELMFGMLLVPKNIVVYVFFEFVIF